MLLKCVCSKMAIWHWITIEDIFLSFIILQQPLVLFIMIESVQSCADPFFAFVEKMFCHSFCYCVISHLLLWEQRNSMGFFYSVNVGCPYCIEYCVPIVWIFFNFFCGITNFFLDKIIEFEIEIQCYMPFLYIDLLSPRSITNYIFVVSCLNISCYISFLYDLLFKAIYSFTSILKLQTFLS